MADINYTYGAYAPDDGHLDTHPNDSEPDVAPSSLGAMMRMLGAVSSLALVLGIGVWGYKLIMRDVTGVPVVRALEGPMREQPDDPGGLQADHQGLAVHAVAADGTAAATAERLMLAPRPVLLAAEDQPVIEIEPQARPENADAQGVATDDLASLSVEALVDQLTGGGQASGRPELLDDDPTEVGEAGEKPDTADAVDTTATQEAEETLAQDSETKPEDAPKIAPGLSQSLRPVARPARAVSSVGANGSDAVLATAINSAVDAVASLEVDPDTLPAGTRLAQLGAYDSVEIARAEWGNLNVKFEEYLEGKQRVIQKASSGGRTFYRLRAIGFDDLSDARRFCSALVSENADCIPVTVR